MQILAGENPVGSFKAGKGQYPGKPRVLHFRVFVVEVMKIVLKDAKRDKGG